MNFDLFKVHKKLDDGRRQHGRARLSRMEGHLGRQVFQISATGSRCEDGKIADEIHQSSVSHYWDFLEEVAKFVVAI